MPELKEWGTGVGEGGTEPGGVGFGELGVGGSVVPTVPVGRGAGSSALAPHHR